MISGEGACIQQGEGASPKIVNTIIIVINVINGTYTYQFDLEATATREHTNDIANEMIAYF